MQRRRPRRGRHGWPPHVVDPHLLEVVERMRTLRVERGLTQGRRRASVLHCDVIRFIECAERDWACRTSETDAEWVLIAVTSMLSPVAPQVRFISRDRMCAPNA